MIPVKTIKTLYYSLQVTWRCQRETEKQARYVVESEQLYCKMKSTERDT